MTDRKITNKELVQGLTVDGIEILPPTTEETLAQLRQRRAIPFVKIYGKVYYQVSELVKWVESKKVTVA